MALGALIGLPAALSKRNYSMTATVSEDAELGFWSPTELDALLCDHPDICQQLLSIMGERLADNQATMKALLKGNTPPVSNAKVV